MNFTRKLHSSLQGLFFVIISLSVVSIAHSQPIVSGVNGTISHSNSATITGSGFGSKTSASPLAFGDMENNSLSARIGSWTQTGYPSGVLSVSTLHPRNANSTYSAACNLNVMDEFCAFQQQTSSTTWYAQYWVYLDSSFNWGEANIKLFRLWANSSGSENLRVQSYNRVDVNVEGADEGHGGYFSGSCPASGGWWPVVPGGTCADAVFGHTCNCGDVLPGSLEWRNFQSDVAKGSWHLFQFEYQDGSANTANGVLRWWVDGKQVFNRTNITTRTDSRPKFLQVLGFYRDALADGSGLIYLDDLYADTTWQRIEIGNNVNYNNCTLKEIQLPTSWSDSSITLKINQGSFANGATGYVFITDASGTRNTGYSVTFGSSGGGTDTIAPVTSISPVAGAYALSQTISLSCLDNSACASTYYCWGATCTPTSLYSTPVTIQANTMRYYSKDSSNNSESVKSSVYTITATAVNGTCGSSNGLSLSSAPATNLCALGTPSTVTGSGPWSWSCSGSGGGSTASCSASLYIPASGSIQRNECLNPPAGSIFCADFEAVNPKSAFDDYDGNPDSENLVITDAGPANDVSNKAVKLWVAANQVGASDLVKVLPANDILYARWYFKFETGFNFNNNNHGGGMTAGDRSYIGLSNNRPIGNDFASFLVQPWSSSGTVPFSYTYYRGMYQNCSNPVGSCWGDSFPCVYDNGSPSCTKPADRPTLVLPQLTAGQWYCYEQMVNMGTTSTDGVTPAPTGRITQWLDGVQFGDNTNLWLRTASTLKLQNLWLNLFVNSTSHSASGQLIDNIVVSTQRIGCGGSVPLPIPDKAKATSITQ